MSTTADKRALSQATRDAEAFRQLFAGTFDVWEIAGSIRRRKPFVADIDHVVIPRTAPGVCVDLFKPATPINLLWRRCDDLLASGEITKAVYGLSGKNCWGEKKRGVCWRGCTHEINTAEVGNLGSVLAIKTGPAEYSKGLVTGLLRNGRRNHLGQVWRCDPCEACRGVTYPPGNQCGRCDGTRLQCVEVLPCPDEHVYFELCGVVWVEPEKR